MISIILRLIQQLQLAIAAIRDLRDAINTNSVRVKHLNGDVRLLTLQVAANTAATTESTAANVANGILLAALIPLLQKLADSLNPDDAASFSMTLANADGSNAVQGDSPMAVELPDDTGPKLLTLVPRDKKGLATTLDGPATFASSDPAVATVVSAGDLVGRIDFLDTSRPVQIQFSGDARMGPDVVPIAGTLDITFTAGEAASFDAQLSDAPAA